jgi:hypothetical protein
MNQMPTEYKRTSNRNQDLLEKEGLLPSYDSSLVVKMIQESQVLEQQINRFMINTEPLTFTIKDMKGQTAFWEIQFIQPVIQYVPSCFRFITTNMGYYLDKGQFAEYVPSYLLNLNHVSLLVNYNAGRRSEYADNTEGIFKKFVLDGGKKMIFSSLNLLLKGAYKGSTLSQKAHTAVKHSFEYCFWNLPVPTNLEEVSCVNNLIYSSSYKISDVLMTRKTLVKILKIETRKEKRVLLKNEISGYSAQVLILTDDGHQLQTSTKPVFLTEDVADSVTEGDVFNAVLTSTVKSKGGRFFIIGKIGKTVTPDNLNSLISIVFWKMLQELEDNTSPTKIGTANQIKTKLTTILQTNSRMFSSENASLDMLGWTKDLPKKISQCIENLYPLFFEDDENIYQLSPVLLGFVISNFEDLLDNKKFMLSLAKMFDVFKIDSNQHGDNAKRVLRTSAPYTSIQMSTELNPEKILQAQPRLLNRMVYSRIFSQHYTHW